MAPRHTLIMTTLLVLAACLPAGHQADPWEAAPAGRVAQVAVQNQSDRDMEVYATAMNRARRRIGTVMRASTGNLVIPGSMLTWANAELTVVPVGGGMGRTLSCPKIAAGARILLVVEQEADLSSCSSNRPHR
jgi:hypothetical protein